MCHVGQLPIQIRVQAVRTSRVCRTQVGSHQKDEGELRRVPDTTGRGGHVCGEQAQVQGGSRNYYGRMRGTADLSEKDDENTARRIAGRWTK